MGSSSNNSASNQARRDEQERLARIANTQGAINRVFNDPTRAADIADAAEAVGQLQLQNLDEQKAQNDRQLKFALARNGQIGGKVQLDKQAGLARDYSKGLLEVDAKKRGFASDIEAADQDARARLISLATSGLDATTAAQQSSAAMRSALEAGKSSAQLQGLSDVFGQFTNFYQQSRDAAARRRGITDARDQLYAGYGG